MTWGIEDSVSKERKERRKHDYEDENYDEDEEEWERGKTVTDRRQETSWRKEGRKGDSKDERGEDVSVRIKRQCVGVEEVGFGGYLEC